ncbi:competence protein ComK [Virgibacillus sp. C22-A2]|uniref:Competence protein ComK n=1 Tax=Virgibacillus tibetensis TaxID=3042313 RepID=A0ABU6KHF8_9BACI|nr:competence protein ComK [Virgibacillus sp. C22-A2]
MEQRASSVYIISPLTKAILTTESTYYRSLILEKNTKKKSIYTAEQIIDHNCLLDVSSIEGRRTVVKSILNASSKLPIPVSVEQGLYMLPTASTKNKDRVWLAYEHIEAYEQDGENTYITFRDGSGIYVNISQRAIDMQYKRASQVIVALNRPVIFGRSPYSR